MCDKPLAVLVPARVFVSRDAVRARVNLCRDADRGGCLCTPLGRIGRSLAANPEQKQRHAQDTQLISLARHPHSRAPQPRAAKANWRRALTIPPHHHRRGGAENRGVGHHVSDYTRVVPHVWRLHFGDVQVACPLRDKTASVLLQKAPLSVENPRIFDFWQETNTQIDFHHQKLGMGEDPSGYVLF